MTLKKIRGLYIEDEKANISTYSRFFKFKDIEIHAPEELFESPSEYYELVCELDIDFIIIDNHLDKAGVAYDGFDILKEIRKQDSNIYIILLTNFDYSNRQNSELGELDQAIRKESFKENFEEVISRIKRAHQRRVDKETTEQIQEKLKLEIDIADKELKKLDDISLMLDQCIKLKSEKTQEE